MAGSRASGTTEQPRPRWRTLPRKKPHFTIANGLFWSAHTLTRNVLNEVYACALALTLLRAGGPPASLQLYQTFGTCGGVMAALLAQSDSGGAGGSRNRPIRIE
jgi:hypothetical protein